MCKAPPAALLPNNIMEALPSQTKQRGGWEMHASTWQLGEIPNSCEIRNLSNPGCPNNKQPRTNPNELALPRFWRENPASCCWRLPALISRDNQKDRTICMPAFSNDSDTKKHGEGIYQRIHRHAKFVNITQAKHCHVLDRFNNSRLCPGFPGQGDRCGSFVTHKQCDYVRCVLAKADTGAVQARIL